LAAILLLLLAAFSAIALICGELRHVGTAMEMVHSDTARLAVA
jgi:hypothetical protein